MLDQVETRFGLPDRGGEPSRVPRSAALVAMPCWLVQRGGVRGALGREPFQHDLDVHSEVSGDLAGPGGAAVALGEFGGGVVDLPLQRAQSPW